MPEVGECEELVDRGEQLLVAGRREEAGGLAHIAVQSGPLNARALHLAGSAAAANGDFAQSAELLNRALAIDSSRAAWHADLATVYFCDNRESEAQAAAYQALVHDARCAVAHRILASTAIGSGRDYRACEHTRALAALCPDRPDIRARLALAEYSVGNVLEVIRLIGASLADGTATSGLHSEYVSALLLDPRQTRETIRLASERWAHDWCPVRARGLPPRERLKRGRRLRIGYVSAGLDSSPTRHFILPVLRNHDRERFEITCYHNRLPEDHHSACIRQLVDRWRNCAKMSYEDLAQCIENDEIDILIDLSGHHRWHRLAVFRLRPAPIQLAFPDYPSTTGIPEMNGILTDAWVCPAGFESQYTEKPYRLSHGYLMYEPPQEAPPVKPLPFDTTHSPVFGLFQRASKCNPSVWDRVAEILRACEGSRLLVHDATIELDECDSLPRAIVKRELSQRGVSPHRALFAGRRSLAAHLDLLSSVDIALDTWPYNGATTTCESLWMGVPVITVPGEIHAGRVGYELLDRIGLGDLVAESPGEYVTTAIHLARDVQRMRELRRGLRDRVRRSTLLNAEPAVREMESVCLQLWNEFVEKIDE
jgi:predicted O-linked N-acetylglucosamine transferase (SPINDLY family)